MKNKALLTLILLGLSGFSATAQTPTPTADQLNAIKSLPQDQQNALLQGVMGGKGDGTGKKTDPQLQTPDTVQKKPTQDNEPIRLKEEKTSDGRILRAPYEDPELRPDDTVLIDLTLIDRTIKKNNNNNNPNAPNTPGMANFGNNAPNPTNGAGSSGANGDSINGSRNGRNDDGTDNFGRGRLDDTPLTDDAKAKLEKLRERILRNNPYRLNAFGVLEIPGLPSIPLAGLTAAEATRRLSADPDLKEFYVKVSLLRLQEFGELALKPLRLRFIRGRAEHFCARVGYSGAGRLYRRTRRHAQYPAIWQCARLLRVDGRP